MSVREDGPMTLTLPDFLLARIAEDEEVARDTLTAHELLDWSELGDPAMGMAGPTDGPSGYVSIVIDPARVLAECEAKRAVVGLHPEMLGWCQGCAHESYPCRTLLALALPYADHPDYREEWRP